MLIEQIAMFDRIAKEKSISKAALASHISQPAVSQQMQRLEEELGVKLLERSNRGIVLTRAGEVMQKYSEQFLETYANLKEELDNLQTHSGTFRIAATPVACNYALPCCLYKVNHKYPNYSFSLNSIPSNEVIHRIERGQADLGFIVGKTEAEKLVCTNAFCDKICLAASSGFHLPDRITLEELKRIPMVMLNEQFSTHRLLRRYLDRQGYPVEQFPIMFQLDSTESVKSTVMAGHGVAFLPYITIKKEVYQKQIKIIPVTDFDLTYDVYSIYRTHDVKENKELEAIVKYFISIVSKSIC
ncbi:MAG: LysR family transcriptional regulator [Lachnospiraceae bacterium]